MKKIKFRGQAITGEYVFSNSIEFEKVGGLNGEQPYLRNENGKWIRCEPESIVQLVGYDANGNEIYEGDSLFYEGENEGVPAEKWFALAMDIYPAGTKLTSWHFKEE